MHRMVGSTACVGVGEKEKKEKAKEKTKQMARGYSPRRRHSRKKSDPMLLWMQDDDEKALGMGSFLQQTTTVEARGVAKMKMTCAPRLS